MALPPTATPFKRVLGPADKLDFYVYLLQADPDHDPAPVLLTGEGVASYGLAPTTEAIAAGLQIIETGRYASTLDGNELMIGFKVDPVMRRSPMFNGAGVLVGIEISITTTEDREQTLTALLRIANR